MEPVQWVAPAHRVAFGRALASSVTASAAHFCVLTAGVELLGLNPLVANALAAAIGALTNFALNRVVAYRARHGSVVRQGGRYALCSLTNLAWVTLLMHVGTTVLGLPYQLAWLGSAMATMTLFSYPAHRVFIFSAGTQRPAGHELPAWGARVLRTLGTVGGLGLVPRAPGTAGTLAALPVIWLLRDQPAWLQATFAGAVIGSGIVVADALGRHWGTDDDQRIVLDEVAGMLVAMLAVPVTWVTLLVGFVLFRAADMAKPWPAGVFDRRKDGLGCILDDVAAGAWVLVAMHVGIWAIG